jgi:hypothetical protein
MLLGRAATGTTECRLSVDGCTARLRRIGEAIPRPAQKTSWNARPTVNPCPPPVLQDTAVRRAVQVKGP